MTAVLVPQAGDEAAPDPCRTLLRRLAERTYTAHLHRAVLGAHGVRPEDAGETLASEKLYTARTFPVRLARREEWAPSQGGALELLEPALHAELLGLCGTLRAEPPARHSALRRLALQAELWTAFDGLHLDGAAGFPPGDPRAERRERLLDALGGAILHVALQPSELAALPAAADVRRELLGAVGAEFYTLEGLPVHDEVNRFRKVSRFFYADPGRDFARLSEAEAARLRDRTLPLGPGAVALLEEDLVAVTPSGGLRPTEVPSVVKYYRVVGGENGAVRLEFGMRLLDPWAAEEDVEPGLATALVPYDGEAWALINLPNIPGHGQPAFRAPLHDTCLGCHGRTPNAFRARIQRPLDVRHFEFTRGPQPWTAQRAVQVKALTAEFADLQRRTRRTAQADTPAPPPRASTALSAAVALGVLGVGLWVGRRRRGALTPEKTP